MREAFIFRLSSEANSDELHRKSIASQLIVAAVFWTSVPRSQETKQTHRPGHYSRILTKLIASRLPCRVRVELKRTMSFGCCPRLRGFTIFWHSRSAFNKTEDKKDLNTKTLRRVLSRQAQPQ